jgi:hypothetical protein
MSLSLSGKGSVKVRASHYLRLGDVFRIFIDDKKVNHSETIWISASSESGHHHFTFNLPLKEFGLSAREVCGKHEISGRCANYIDLNGDDPMNIFGFGSHHRMASPFDLLSLNATYYPDKNLIQINSRDAPEFWINIRLL